MAIIENSALLVKIDPKTGEEYWIYPITTADNVTLDEEQLDEVITAIKTDVAGKIPSSDKGKKNGIASLDENGTLPQTQLPSRFGVCSTAAATAAKTASITGYTLQTGIPIIIKFTVTNTASNPTLNINSTGAKAIRYRNAAISASTLAANRFYIFIYDGTYYQFIGDIDSNTWTAMKGATTSAAGGAGYVPAPSAGAANRYLRSDGTWQVPPDNNTTYSDMTGATANAAGSAGLVPSAPSGAQAKFLRGDATWSLPTKSDVGLGNVDNKSSATIRGELTKKNVTDALGYTPPESDTTYSSMTGAGTSTGGTSGLVPAPSAGAANRYLRSDGTWQVPPDTKVTIDSALSDASSNPVQNKIVKAAIDDLLNKINNMIQDAPEAYDTFKEIADYIATHKNEYEALLAVSNDKVDKVSGKGLSTNDFTTDLLNKLNGIATGANKTTVDSALSSSSTNPVQNKIVKSALDAKAAITTLTNQNLNSVTAPGFYNAAGGNTCTNKPDGVDNFGMIVTHNASGNYYTQILFFSTYVYRRTCSNGTWSSWSIDKYTDTVYTHPTTSGNKHIPAGGSSGQILRWSADGTAVWGNDNNTTYSDMTGATANAAGKAGLVPAPASGKQGQFLRGDGTWATPTNTTYNDATTTTHGLMTPEDKSKLNLFEGPLILASAMPSSVTVDTFVLEYTIES